MTCCNPASITTSSESNDDLIIGNDAVTDMSVDFTAASGVVRGQIVALNTSNEAVEFTGAFPNPDFKLLVVAFDVPAPGNKLVAYASGKFNLTRLETINGGALDPTVMLAAANSGFVFERPVIL